LAGVHVCCGIIPRPVLVKDSRLSEISPKPPIVTEVVIIGAGPCGLFQVFELGLLGMGCHLVDSLGAPGGQCTELYPDKPIYDIPALPTCGAQELIDRLMQQIAPFNAPLHLGQEVTGLHKRDDGRFDVETALGTRFDAGAVVIAGGVGSFQPRRIGVPGADVFENRTIHYRVRDAAQYHGKKLAIFGGGDSALDWVIDFAGKAASVTHIHRRPEFRAAPASVAKMQGLAAAGQVRYIEGLADSLITSGDASSAQSFQGINVKGHDSTPSRPITCSRSSACTRSSVPSPSGAWSSRRRRSGWIPRNSRPASRASSPWETSTPTPVRRS
jgi:thioredoxin reductase (NADPH)